MPFLLAVIGAALVISAVRGTQGSLGSQIASDVPGFLPWAGAIVILGMLGYVPNFQKPANLLLALVVLVLFLNKGSGFFGNFGKAFDQAQIPAAPNTNVPQPSAQLPVQLTVTGGANMLGSILGLGGSGTAAAPAIDAATAATGGLT